MILFRDQFVEREEIRISPDDRGYYFGDGLYEVFRVYGGALFEKEAHFARLARTANALRIRLPEPIDELERKLEQLVAREQIGEGTVYMQITRGEAPRAHSFPAKAEPVLMAYAQEVKRPLGAMESGISAVTVADVRWLRCDLKTLNLLGNVMAKQEALDRGAQESILHRDGVVTECSASNVMIVKDGALFTHPANHLILHGVTRAVVLRLALAEGIAVREEPFDLQALAAADEAFITGTTVEVTPIVRIDGLPVGTGKPGPITRQLQQAFNRLIGEE